jgi:CheY-like chemotaxis protein
VAGTRIVAEAANGIEAVELGESTGPTSPSSTSACRACPASRPRAELYDRSHIVFATAYDQYALDAFEQGALDYLLKPVSNERLATTCARLRARLEAHPASAPPRRTSASSWRA